MKVFRIAICFFTLQLPVLVQSQSKNVSTATTVIGTSAISLNTLVAKSYNFNFPFYNRQADSANNLFIFSLRQKADDGKTYLSKSFIGAVDCTKDSLSWFSESNTYNLQMDANALFFSSDVKTIKVNKQQGFEETKYTSPLLHAFTGRNKGFMYLPAGSEVLSCVSLEDGSVNWTATISGKENWVDAKTVKDTVLVIAASGLSAVGLQKGLLWTYPLITAEKVDKALTYSLANDNKLIQGIAKISETSRDENTVTEIASNLLADENGTVYFASKEKMIAVDADGKLLWELDLKAYPVSKMYLSKNGSAITLINFGLAKCADNYVLYGKPFIMQVDAGNGKMNSHGDLSAIDNLIDFKETPKAFLFAGKNLLLEVKKGSLQVDTLLKLDIGKFGNFAEFIDGDNFHTEKEGFYVTLNFLNDNPVYFRADNNKIYSALQNVVNYEYHFNEIYKREVAFGDKLLLRGENKSLIISKNMELLATLNLPFKGFLLANTLVLTGDNQLHLLDVKEIR